MLRTVLHRAEEMLLGLILAAMTLLTFVQVILRYVFNSGLLWGLEATLYLFGWLVLLGISYGVRTHAHIGVDIAVKALPIGPRRIVGILVVAASIGYACLMFYGAWKYTDRMMILGVEAEDLPIQRWVLGLCLPIGFALLFIRLVETGWAILKGEAPGFELGDEASEILSEPGIAEEKGRQR